MRFRSAAVLSLAAVAALALSACSGGGEEPEPEASANLCDAAAPSGKASDAVEVDGSPGEKSTATFESPLEIPEVQRTVVDEGDEKIKAGQWVNYATTAYDATTGEEFGSSGYEEGQLLPAQVSPDSPFGQFVGCAGPGSRLVLALPETQGQQGAQGQQAQPTPSQIYVLDVLSTNPTAAWGDQQEPAEGMPAVELADDGEPSVTIPEGEAPAETQVTNLKQGDGLTVEQGDTALVQYSGVKWSDGEIFDSSWERGQPAPMATDQVVPGFQKALVGQQVGSQVLVVMPPADAYGPQEGHELQEETLVFVIDILAAQHPAQPQGQ